MVREALSFIPQATVVDTLNHAWIELSRKFNYLEVTQQGHDSLIIQVDETLIEKALSDIASVFAAEYVTINNMPRHIPFDFMVGKSWGSLEKVSI